MSEANLGIVLLGESVGPRRDPRATRGWLARLGHELDERFRDDRLLPFLAADGVELRGLLRPSADPLAAVLQGALRAEGRRMRWAIAYGSLGELVSLAGEPASEASLLARGALERARRQHDTLVLVTGDHGVDGLLEALGPVLGDMLARLTARQRLVARLMLIDGRRQAEVAEELGVSRATISVNVARSRLRSLSRLISATGAVFAAGIAAQEGTPPPRPWRPRGESQNKGQPTRTSAVSGTRVTEAPAASARRPKTTASRSAQASGSLLK